MSLFELTDERLAEIPTTTFAAEGILERQNLQRVLRHNIRAIDDSLLVVSEEFGDFEGSDRRIDLLCIDRGARLVVVELKRTQDGGHMELQALRYAAMVSSMTFDNLVDTFERYLRKTDPSAADDARGTLTDWLEDTDDEPVISADVRIVLVSAGFGTEITTTVLWLNQTYNLDIRCIRLIPHRVDGRLLLDITQLIPLPEAEEFTIKLRRREQAVRAAAGGRDWTRYVVTSPSGSSPPLRKRWAVLAMVQALHEAGVPAAKLAEALPKAVSQHRRHSRRRRPGQRLLRELPADEPEHQQVVPGSADPGRRPHLGAVQDVGPADRTDPRQAPRPGAGGRVRLPAGVSDRPHRTTGRKRGDRGHVGGSGAGVIGCNRARHPAARRRR